MSILSISFNAARAWFSNAYSCEISDLMLFDMPDLNDDTAILLGATSATALIAAKAFEKRHKRFVIVGGNNVGNESSALTRLLNSSHKDMGLPLPPHKEMSEKDYGRYVLEQHFGVKTENITTFDDDRSSNTQQNLEVLKTNGFFENPALEIYSLAGTARRVLMTARKLYGYDTVLSAHNCYPHGFDKTNWRNSLPASMYVFSEAAKILGKPSNYEKRGFCVPVNIEDEIQGAKKFLLQKPPQELKTQHGIYPNIVKAGEVIKAKLAG